MRAVGILVAVFRVADRLIDLHFRPIGIQFVRNHQRKRSAAAAAHLRAAGDDGDRPIARNGEKNVRLKNRRLISGGFGPQRFWNKLQAQHKCSGGKSALQKSASADILNADILDVVHAISFAAW